jgi:hypothetical protein
MKNTFREIVQTKLFDSVVAFLLFLIVTLGLSFAIGASFNAVAVIVDIILSLVVAGIVYSTSNSNKLSKQIVKRRSDHLAVVGLLAIGFLLFIVFMIVYIST